MAAIWSAIKGTAASDHPHDGLLSNSHSAASTRPSSSSKVLAGTSPQTSPRSPSSGEPRGESTSSPFPSRSVGLVQPPVADSVFISIPGLETERQKLSVLTAYIASIAPSGMEPWPELEAYPSSLGTSSPSTATPQPLTSLGRRTSSARVTRTNTSAKREKDREQGDAQNADEPVASPSIGGGIGPGVARATPPAQSPSPGSALDPLSQHIYQRTNTDHSIPHRLRTAHPHPSRPDSPTQVAEGIVRSSSDLNAKNIAPAGDVSKDKSKKASSFLSRLGMRSIRKKDAWDIDSDSEVGSEARMDGINALVFSQSLAGPFAGAGYTPHHKEPPRYIRTKANNKKTREFNRMFLAQELVGTQPPKNEDGSEAIGNRSTPVVTVSVAGANGRKVARTGGAVWATEFSKDGKYMATAGKDNVVRIWAVISTPEDRRACEEEEAANGGTGERLSAPVFRGRPVREFEGHRGEVLDLSWSKNNFLLSSSMDKTVRLWHMSRPECLCTFKHKDFVTRLAFHPTDDRFFLAGSLDTMLRLWSIPDKAIAFSEQLPDLVTAVAFSPDGKTAIAGLLNGLCLFYETEGLKLQSQIHVRSSRGKNAKGSKITNIQTMNILPNMSGTMGSTNGAASQASADASSQGDVRVLITSNDSRVRIYNLREKTLEVKLKGHDNACSQIAATFSDDGNYVICGSENRKAFIWSLNGNMSLSQDKDKAPCEYFDAHGDVVTTALFAPTKTRMLLGQSGDPIYDLCNPPPIVLRSLGETTSAAASQTALSTDEGHADTASRRPEPSAAYIARSTHYDGNIIVTTDDTGIIKVFRQDCAFTKRRNENWETGSTLSRKLTAHGSIIVGGGLGRSASILTRTSASSAAHSRRGSLSQSVTSGAVASPKLPPPATNSDRILSWRQSIEHSGDKRHSLLHYEGTPPVRSERSASPAKAGRKPGSTAANLASEARRQPYAGSSRPGSTLTSPTASVFSNTPERPSVRLMKDRPKLDIRGNPTQEDDMPIPTPSFTFRPANEDGQGSPTGTSGSFWNLGRWRGKGSKPGQVAGHSRALSSGSLLTRSRSTMDGGVEEREQPTNEQGGRRKSLGLLKSAGEEGRRKSIPLPHDEVSHASDSDVKSIPTVGAPSSEVGRDRSPYRQIWSGGEDEGIEEEEEVCEKCGSKDFKVKKQRLSCGRCGALVGE
ncbi:hypothetical protein OQA88_5321 [Cercophora sp. LCS_1]